MNEGPIPQSEQTAWLDVRSWLVQLFAILTAWGYLPFPFRSKHRQVSHYVVDIRIRKKFLGEHVRTAMPLPDGVEALLIILRLKGGRISKVCRLRVELVEQAAQLRLHLRLPVDVSVISMAFVAESFAVIDLPALFTIPFDLG